MTVTVAALVVAACRTSPAPTFAQDIAPIIHANCVICHRPGRIAPFSLLAYDDVRAHAAQILRAVESREMPPWLPAAGVHPFRNARVLGDGQIALIRGWVERGAPRGDAAAEPAPPAAPADGWTLGVPDLVITLPSAYTLEPGGTDRFRNFVFPVAIDHEVFVRGVEFLPGSPRAIHHAVIGVDASGESRRLDAADREPGYEGMFADEFHSPDGHFIGWTPGRTPELEPGDRAWRLQPGTDLVVQLHMLPADTPVELRPRIGLYSSAAAPTSVPFMVKLTSTTIDIPAGATDYSVEDAYTLPVDVDALSIYPHAHYLARRIEALATLPSGQTQSLLEIGNWDFHWQEFYRYVSPVALPRGTRLSMRITYDNSAAHQPRNGTTPQRVVYGPRSSDEMGDVWLQVVPRTRDDLGVLIGDYERRRGESRIRAAEEAVRRAPGDASLHDRLGSRYLAMGRIDAAVEAFSQAVRLSPDSPEARNNLGTSLVAAGRASEAVPHLEIAARARPDDERVHFNFGNALRAVGRPAQAVREFERVLAINSQAADALNNLATIDGARGDYARAITRLQRALSIREAYPDAHHNLALALAATGRRTEALVHVRRALELTPQFPDARATLAELERR